MRKLFIILGLIAPLCATAQIVRDGVSVSTIDGVNLEGGKIDGVSVAAGGGAGTSPGTANLIAWWSMDTAATSASDSHSNGLDLGESGSVLEVTGKVSNAADYDTGNNYLSLADNSLLEIGDTAFSILCWAQVSADSNGGLIQKFTTTGDQREYALWYDAAIDKFKFSVSTDGTSGGVVNVTCDDFGTVSLGTWYVVAAYHDPTANEIGISITLQDETAGTWTTAAVADGGVFAGTSGSLFGRYANTSYLDGYCDELSVWSTVLTADNITWFASVKGYSDL